MVNFGQAAVGIILLLVVVGGLLYIFYSRTNAVEKTGYGALIMLALVSLMIPVFWILESNNQASAQVEQHGLALERGMLLYIQYCPTCFGIKNDKVVNATYNGFTIADLNQLNDDNLRRTISAGIYNGQPANPNAVPRSDQYGGALLSNDVDYLFQFIRSASPDYLQKKGLPPGSGFDKLPDYLKNNNPTLYQSALALGNPVDFGPVTDMTAQKAVTVHIVKPSSALTHCKSQTACYDISNLKVKVGTVITWINTDAVPHTVSAIVGDNTGSPTVAAKIFDSGLTPGIKTGGKFTYTVTADAFNFNPNHSVIYYCQYHSDMLAQLTIVQ